MTKPVAVDKLLYTPVEAAHALRVGRSTIYVLVAKWGRTLGAHRLVPPHPGRRLEAVHSVA